MAEECDASIGDTHVPFAKLGRSLNLPQTATLSIRGPEKYVQARRMHHGSLCIRDRIPYLDEDEEGYQWFEAFDALGETLRNPNPSKGTDWILFYIIHGNRS